ncbi:hypothetical protein GGX14DRAFT_381985 [Mycena pura]|uniref:Peptidase C14 caspase domain-containing protein n=1 Tax=Mycena pura TaxID=153505 RepID=A0AAD6URQ7_9AGAR|nr:hypothetical protein GGX14DRAFT_381985 [Mycena pura]
MKDFLLSDLRVPADRIVNLRDQEATRDAIINALKNIAINPVIGPQDPILIFYAGHGAEATAPVGWAASDNKIQMLIPHDFIQQGSGDIRGQGIFDMTLSRILEKIADVKSDNISVILDSCHSGSGTRDPRDETFACRGVELPKTYDIPLDVLKAESGTRASVVAKGHEKSGLRSHVLLAACMRGQTAKERHGRGAFTSQLLELLKGEGVDRLTYKDVVTRLPDLPLQNPQCEGDNQTRILFNSKVASPYRALFNIAPAVSKPGEYILEAGEAHGITPKAQFSVFRDKKMTELLGTVEVTGEVNPFRARCNFGGGASFSLTGTAYALQTRVGESQDLRLFVEANEAFLDVFTRLGQEMERTDPSKRSFRLVNTPDDKPDFAISVENNLVVFHVMEKTCRDYGLTTIPYRDIRVEETDSIIYILRSAADFYYNLHRSAKTDGILRSKVSVDCLKLVESGEFDDYLDPILVPQAVDNQEVNLHVDGTIIIDVEEDAKYGFRLSNTSAVPLYAAAFYFDASDLSVDPYYLPGTAAAGKADVSIPPKGSLSIGFGDSGAVPRSYILRENQSVDVGFLKVYLSTEYVDYSGIAQASPFAERRASVQQVKKRYLWDTIMIPMIQQKGASSGRGFGFGAGGGLKVSFGASFSVGFGAGFCL